MPLAALLRTAAAVAAAAAAAPAERPPRGGGPHPHPHHHPACDAVHARTAAVSTSNADATEAGMEILRKGGNAFDAAVAAHFAIAVTQPQSTGIGGGAFAVVSRGAAPGAGDALFLDGREEAPAAFHPNIFCRDSARCLLHPCDDCPEGASSVRSTGGLSAGVPGFVAMSERLHREHGSGAVSWEEALEPARRLAADGFAMYASLHSSLTSNRARLRQFPASVAAYLPEPGEHPVPIGGTFRQPDLAATIEEMQHRGAAAFYDTAEGRIGADIAAAARGASNSDGQHGVMEPADVAGYRAVWRRPTLHTVTLGGEEVGIAGAPPPSSGGTVVGGVAGVVALFDPASYRSPTSADYVHRSLDAQALMWADRSRWLADADFVDVPLTGVTNLSYLEQRVADLLHPLHAADIPVPYGNPPGSGRLPRHAQYAGPYENGTLHLTVADGERNFVSITSTIESGMGSAVVVPGRGFVLNNELTDFTPLGSDDDGVPYANRPEGGKRARRTALGGDAESIGGKRPLSSMSPTIAFAHGRPLVALGSPGGTTIPSSVLSALLASVAFHLPAQAAVDAPRKRCNNADPNLEPGIYDDEEVLAVLRARGFNPRRTSSQGSVQLIAALPDGALCAAADTSRSATAKADGI